MLWVAALVLLAIVWGGSVPTIKLGLDAFPPLTLTTLRYLTAAPFFALLLLGKRLPPLRTLGFMAALGVVGVAIGQLLQSVAVARTTASAATIISALIPMLVVVFAAFRLKQKLRLRHVAGLATAFLGIVLVAVGDPRDIVRVMATSAFEGDLLMLLCGIIIAAYYVFSAELVARYGAVVVGAWTSLAGTIALVPLMLLELQVEPAHPSVEGVLCILYLGLFVTVFGLWLWFQALACVPARVAGSVQYLQPVVGIALSAIVFGETLDLWFLAGTVAVLAGIALSTMSPGRRAARGEVGAERNAW